MSDDRPIGIFDSGIGGLSVLLKVKKLLPHESIVYFADQARAPYGLKTEKQLKLIARNAVEFLLTQNVKLVIVACNTATVYTIEYLRSKFDIPIIGTAPVVKTLADNTKSGKIAVFSTPATAKSQYLKDLIRKFADGKKVFIVGSTNLESLIEKGNIDDPKIDLIFKKHLLPLKKEGVDSLALACTHYPFLRNKIRTVLNGEVKIYDSGGAIARQTKKILTSNKTLGKGKAEYTFFTSGEIEDFKKVAKALTGLRLDRVGRAEI